MTKLDIVIGREENLHRLLVKMGQKAFVVGSPHSVPNSVSRNHCALVVEFSDDSTRKVLGIVIRNLNLQNSTYVDEQEIETKKIKESSKVQLGKDRYTVDLPKIIDGLRKILNVVTPPPPPEFSILHLKTIWEEYDSRKIEIQLAEQKKNNLRGVGGILSGIGVLFMFIPALGMMRYIATGISVIIALAFFIRGMNPKNSLTIKMHDLDKDFRHKYICPNPKCGHNLGNTPYDVLRQNKGCNYCKCIYKE